jgi:hypothetical protein
LCCLILDFLPCKSEAYFDFGDDSCRWIPSLVLELLDQKAQDFLVPIALKWLFPEHVCKVFGEMRMRT